MLQLRLQNVIRISSSQLQIFAQPRRSIRGGLDDILTHTQVEAYVSLEQHRVLRNDGHVRSKSSKRNRLRIDITEFQAAARRVVESLEQCQNRYYMAGS